jgi:enoyl-CoA hydratase/carnithine racemase
MSGLVTFALSKANPRVGIITLNSPKTLNAMTFPIGAEFKNLVGELNKALTTPTDALDPVVGSTPTPSLPDGVKDVNALILTGAGRAFSAGGDMKFLKSRLEVPPHTNAATMMNFYTNFLSLRSLPVPIIAAINGPAIGAGACVTLACDYRVTTKSNQIAFNFCKLGIHPGMGGSHYLPRLVGPAKAAKVMLGAGRMTGVEAKDMGVVDELFEEETFLDDALALATTIADNSPVAVRGMTRTLRMQVDVGLEESLRREANEQAVCYARQDWLEGLDAVMSKREPEFSPFFSK